MKIVYAIPQKIKTLSDKRKRKTIPLFNIIMPVLLFLTLQYESFHTIFSSPESMKKRLRHCIKGRIPKVDAVRDLLALMEPEEIRDIHDGVLDRIKRNRVLREGTIGGFVVAAIDGVELFCSTKKSCPDCLKRQNRAGETEYVHRSVVCATVGSDPHLILGQEMLRPRDGAEKDEGELTGAKRLLRRLRERHGHFADVITADALYLNAPFVNQVLDCGMDAVIRLKDERKLIYQDAKGLFSQGLGEASEFQSRNMTIRVWDLSGFRLEGVCRPLRVVKYRETEMRKGKEESREMWLVTTLIYADNKILWRIMHKRWDIEENGFHQLKTYYHADHCYCHSAIEVVFELMLIGFNLRELYLYRRIRNFRESGISRKSVSRKFKDDLLLWDVRSILYNDDG